MRDFFLNGKNIYYYPAGAYSVHVISMATTAALFKTGAWRRVIGAQTSFFAASRTRQFSTSTAAHKKVD